jgi:integrase
MNTVEPIRDENTILDFADYLKEKCIRDFVLFMSGIYLGLRISDILPLKVRDVKNADYLFLTEKKTGKKSRIKINDELKQIYKEYIVGMRDYEFLFQPTRGKMKNHPITRQRVWQILNAAADEFEYKDPIGCHTLRKTFGYLLYSETKDAAALQDIFRHSSIGYTKRYIGVTQDSKDKMMNKLSFGIKKR